MRTVVVLLLSATFAAPQSTYQERGEAVIRETLAALGGDNFLKLRNKVEKGRVYQFYRTQVSGLAKSTIYTRYLTAPDPPNPDELYIRERQGFGEDEKWWYLFNEDDGFEVTYRGAKPLAEETVQRVRDSRQRDIFYILMRRMNEKGLIFEHRGNEVIDNRPTIKVDITDAKNRVVTVFLHYTTKLPVRQVFYRRDKTRFRHEEVTYYDNYRDVGGGVMLPYIIQRDRDGERSFALFATSVTINEDLTDEMFALPFDTKILERQK